MSLSSLRFILDSTDNYGRIALNKVPLSSQHLSHTNDAGPSSTKLRSGNRRLKQRRALSNQ